MVTQCFLVSKGISSELCTLRKSSVKQKTGFSRRSILFFKNESLHFTKYMNPYTLHLSKREVRKLQQYAFVPSIMWRVHGGAVIKHLPAKLKVQGLKHNWGDHLVRCSGQLCATISMLNICAFRAVGPIPWA